MSEYRIVELYRQYFIEASVDGTKWAMVDHPRIPRYHESVPDARSWVATLRKGRVIHSVEDDGLQWFIDRVGKTVVRDAMRVVILDTDHARHLHTASVEMGYVYTDAPNIAQDERKADDGVKPLEWFLERVGMDIRSNTGLGLTIRDVDLAKFVFALQSKLDYRYSDPS